MYNSRIGRRTRRTSDVKDNATLRSRAIRDMRVKDADDDDDVEIGGINLTNEEVQGLLELLPYKEALIKIAKGEFEIEKVEEAEEDEETEEGSEGSEAEEENFEEDEDYSNDEEDADEGEEDFDEEDYDDEEGDEAVEDSAIVDAWSKRLSGNSK